MRRTWLRRLLKVALVAVLAPVLLAAACYVKWCVCDSRLATITPGTVYQSAAFAPDELVDVCRDHGIRTVIDLRDDHPGEVAANAAAVADAGLCHIHLPTETHPTSESVAAFLAAMDRAPRPVLVHCQHGEGRSVMMCAIHRIQNEGWTNEGAFDGTARLPDGLKFLNCWFPGLRRFRESHPKGRFVLGYVKVAEATAPRDQPEGTPAAGPNAVEAASHKDGAPR
jgi:uncharacterized protein (TIGR01244 family)